MRCRVYARQGQEPQLALRPDGVPFRETKEAAMGEQGVCSEFPFVPAELQEGAVGEQKKTRARR